MKIIVPLLGLILITSANSAVTFYDERQAWISGMPMMMSEEHPLISHPFLGDDIIPPTDGNQSSDQSFRWYNMHFLVNYSTSNPIIISEGAMTIGPDAGNGLGLFLWQPYPTNLKFLALGFHMETTASTWLMEIVTTRGGQVRPIVSGFNGWIGDTYELIEGIRIYNPLPGPASDVLSIQSFDYAYIVPEPSNLPLLLASITLFIRRRR